MILARGSSMVNGTVVTTPEEARDEVKNLGLLKQISKRGNIDNNGDMIEFRHQ